MICILGALVNLRTPYGACETAS